MARILAISSQVARGSVGLSIIVPALHTLGHEVIALPTVMLSNHPGHTHAAGIRVDPANLFQMLDALEANGWLSAIDAVLTGYLPSVGHVEFAAAAVERVHAASRSCLYLCDPVLGDDPKGLYIEEAAARAVRDTLLPLARLMTPNRFELSFLSGADVGSAEGVDAAPLGSFNGDLIATSIPSADPGEVLNVWRPAEMREPAGADRAARTTAVTLRATAPNGTGDLFAALVVAAAASSKARLDHALRFATAGVDALLMASAGHDQLLVPALPSALQVASAAHGPRP